MGLCPNTENKVLCKASETACEIYGLHGHLVSASVFRKHAVRIKSDKVLCVLVMDRDKEERNRLGQRAKINQNRI